MWCMYWTNKYLSEVKRLGYYRVGAREVRDSHDLALDSYLYKNDHVAFST